MMSCKHAPGTQNPEQPPFTWRRPSGDSFVLNGSKAFISGGGDTDIYLIMARTGGEGMDDLSCFPLRLTMRPPALLPIAKRPFAPFCSQVCHHDLVKHPILGVYLSIVHLPACPLACISACCFCLVWLAVAVGPKGVSAFIVPKDSPGLSFGAKERKVHV